VKFFGKNFIFVKNNCLKAKYLHITIACMRRLFLMFFLFLIFPVLSIFGQHQNYLVIGDQLSFDSDLSGYLEVFSDSTQGSNVENVQNYSTFKPYRAGEKLSKQGTHWGRLNIKSQVAEKQQIIIQIGNKRSSDFAEMFLFNRGGFLQKHSKSGHFEKGSEKEIPKELGSKFYIELEPDGVYTIYFKIRNISGFKPNFAISVYDKDEFASRLNLRNLVQGMLQGALWIMFLYNLFIFVYSRDRVYLYYSLYIIGIAVNFVVERGLFSEYTASEYPRLEPYVFIFATGLATVAYFQFVRYFLHTKKNMPKWDKAHLWVVYINIAITIILFGDLLFTFNVPISINVSNYLNLIGLLYGFVFIWYLIKQDNKLARFFIAGAIALAVGTIISLYFLITKESLWFDPKYFMNGGTLIELLIFSLGLGYRIRLIEKSKQKVQEELIEQLKQNERIKEEANRELEGKVKERTAEIELQKEEILAQSENMKVANDILTKQKREIENKNEEITQQKRYLEKIHKNTTDSINYASRIQSVILPSANLLNKYFSDHFIFYKPKEIVSGDFYWYRYLERNNKRYFALVAADSTGHGVPGSLVSMLGISLLNETVMRNEVKSSSDVLEVLRDEVKATFSHSDERLLTRDGIDMAFCFIDLDTLEMQYAGANRPLLLFRKNGETLINDELNGLIEYKPTKNPVGIYHKEQPFENHTIQLEKGDVMYLFSDGYADQVGGPDGRKYYFKRFKELLAEIHEMPMMEQRKIIVQTHNDWVNHSFKNGESFRQVDDMMVMGIKV
jgi:serine phosphatase RsbU (regulator of sigma subunit)